jgi:hypothetical protein
MNRCTEAIRIKKQLQDSSLATPTATFCRDTTESSESILRENLMGGDRPQLEIRRDTRSLRFLGTIINAPIRRQSQPRSKEDACLAHHITSP